MKLQTQMIRKNCRFNDSDGRHVFLNLAGVFLIPYFIILVVCGIPMLYMELAVGQYTGRGPIGALGQLCPLFKGLCVSVWISVECHQRNSNNVVD